MNNTKQMKQYYYAQDLKFVVKLGEQAYRNGNGTNAASHCDIYFHPYVKQYSKEPKKLIKLMDAWRKGYFDALHLETSFQGA
jgi:hypothetical protein